MSRRKKTPLDPAKVSLVAEWILAGCRTSQIPAEAVKAKWELSAGELAALTAAAVETIVADAFAFLVGTTRPGLELATCICRLNALYAKCLAIQDYKTALACQKELSKVLDLYAAQGVAEEPGPVSTDGEAEDDDSSEGEGFARILAEVG